MKFKYILLDSICVLLKDYNLLITPACIIVGAFLIGASDLMVTNALDPELTMFVLEITTRVLDMLGASLMPQITIVLIIVPR